MSFSNAAEYFKYLPFKSSYFFQPVLLHAVSFCHGMMLGREKRHSTGTTGWLGVSWTIYVTVDSPNLGFL